MSLTCCVLLSVVLQQFVLIIRSQVLFWACLPPPFQKYFWGRHLLYSSIELHTTVCISNLCDALVFHYDVPGGANVGAHTDVLPGGVPGGTQGVHDGVLDVVLDGVPDCVADGVPGDA